MKLKRRDIINQLEYLLGRTYESPETNSDWNAGYRTGIREALVLLNKERT